MRDIQKITKTLAPLVKAAIQHEPGVARAQALIRKSATNIAHRIQTQNPRAYKEAVKTLESQLLSARSSVKADKLISGTKSITDFAEEVMVELIKDQIDDFMRSAFDPEDNTQLLYAVQKMLKIINTAKTTEEEKQAQPHMQATEAIRKIDPHFQDELVALFNLRITEIATTLATSAASPAEIKALTQEITELELYKDRFFASLASPAEFLKTGKEILDRFSAPREQDSLSYDLSKERKTFTFNKPYTSTELADKARHLQERLTTIKKSLK